MIYIINNTNNRITTDVNFEYVIDKVQIYFDDNYIGEFYNESSINEYLIFTIPSELLVSLNLENIEYKMKIYKDYFLFKTEIISIKPSSNVEIYGFKKINTKIQMYDRN